MQNDPVASITDEAVKILHHEQINAAYHKGIRQCLELQQRQIAADCGDDWLKDKMEALLKGLYC